LNKEAAQRIQAVLSMPGWVDIKQMFDEAILEPREKLAHIMASEPDKLTGKTAIKYAVRARAISDLLEDIEDSQKALPQSERTGGG